MKSLKVFFDLDGTLFDLYGKSDWLYRLENEIEGVFSSGDLMPEISKEDLFEVIADLSAYGVEFNVITWLPMQASREYQETCTNEKIKWVRKNLPFINNIVCQPYGTPKQNGILQKAYRCILIDDNAEVCETWNTPKMRTSYVVNEKFTAVSALIEIYRNIVEVNGE